VTFEWPLALLALLLIPVVALGYLWLERRRRAQDVAAFSSPALYPNVVAHSPGRLRHLPVAILLLAVAVLVTGFARPHAKRSVTRNEATVILAVDVSRSMEAKDVNPTRLAAAGAAISRFLKVIPKSLQVGVVTFSDRANVVAPPTTDRDVVRQALGQAHTGAGTTIGEAISLALRSASKVRGSDGRPPPAAILLVSDGAQTIGSVTPTAAARRAKAAGVPIYTVALGTPDGVITEKLVGGYTERIRVPSDPTTLQHVARASGGQAFTAATDADLKKVYGDLGKRLGHVRKPSEITAAFAGAGVLLLLASGALSSLLFRRLP
jgi:Ca-activated chloride channel family protein